MKIRFRPDSTRADLASQRALKPRSKRVFAILAPVLYFFYLLVVVQIALGLYSLWDGYEWFRLVRGRLSSHAGFYAPVTALICPCKGAEPGLEDNLTALTKFEYANYEIYFVMATSLDPALKVVERVKAASQRPVHIVIAGPAEDCGEKVHNLRRAVESLTDNFEVIVFTDSDVRLPHGWLSKLVAPLQDRASVPPPPIAGLSPAAPLAPADLPALSHRRGTRPSPPCSAVPGENFCWGGGTAIRRSTFNDVRVLEAWEGAISDDFALTRALKNAGRSIVFCSECLAPTLHPWTGSSLLEFTNRQILITRVYDSRRWGMAAAAHLSYVFTLIFAAFVIMAQMADGDPWMNLVLMAFVIPFLAVMKGVLRTIAVVEMLPEWKAQLNQWSWVWTALAPVIPFLFAWNFIASLLTRRIRWRNIRYELVSPSVTRVLQR